MMLNGSLVQDNGLIEQEELAPRALRQTFIVWGAPSLGPRSQVLARELGIRSLHFIQAGSGRGLLSAPARYAVQAIRTLPHLLRERPELVFVQSPPSLAVLVVYIYSRISGAHYIVDAHSAALLQRIWMWPRWLYCRLLRGAVTTLVTNDHFKKQIEAERGNAFVLRDVPTQYSRKPVTLSGEFKVAVVNTFSNDEPLDAVLEAAADLPDIDFYITGNLKRVCAGTLERASSNVHFTGFLPDESYYGLLAAADVVMCLTRREHTMQRGACEALSLGRPIITSDTLLLRSYFDRGTVHVSNTQASIRAGILEQRAHLERYRTEILELRSIRTQEWQDKKQTLTRLIQQAV